MRCHSLPTLARRKIIKKVVLLIRYAQSTLAEAIGSVDEATWSFRIYVSTFPHLCGRGEKRRILMTVAKILYYYYKPKYIIYYFRF